MLIFVYVPKLKFLKKIKYQVWKKKEIRMSLGPIQLAVEYS
jgi:hypothetical protein